MPNILLTTRCNLSCKYCFAQEKLSSNRSNMPMEHVQRVIDFLKRSDFPIFRVMGGEPTLHPQFNEIVQLAIREGMRVDVLSNATWTENTAALFARIPAKHLMFLLNIDHPDNYTSHQWEVIQRNLSAIAGRGGITLSFNVFEKQPRSEYVLNLAEQYGIKYIRLSLSLPVLGANNTYLPIEELPEVTPFVMAFVAEAESRGIGVQFDNAVPLCIFDEFQIGYLLLHGVYDLNRNTRCDPIIDIGPDLTIWSCFCLSSIKNRSLEEFHTLAEAQNYYRKVWSIYQDTVYPMEQCYQCFYREKWGCQGGCLTYAMLKDGGQRYFADQPDPSDEMIDPEWVLCLAEDVRVFHYDLPRPITVLRKTSSNLDLEVDETFWPVFTLLDGQHTFQEMTDAYQSSSSESPYMHMFLQQAATENLSHLILALLQQGFLQQGT